MDTTAKDIMSSTIIVAKESSSTEEALKLLVNNKVTGLPVVNAEGRMIGMVTEYDIMVRLSQSQKPDNAFFQAAMPFTNKVESVAEDAPLKEVLDRLVSLRVRRLPVVDNSGQLVGIISRKDVMRALYYRAKVIE